MTSDDHNPDFHNGYVGVSPEELEVMSDSELAQWQYNCRNEPPKVILAEHEWQRRRTVLALTEQFRLESKLAYANRWWSIAVAIIGVAGALIGAWFGAKWQAPATNTKPPPSAQPLAPTDATKSSRP